MRLASGRKVKKVKRKLRGGFPAHYFRPAFEPLEDRRLLALLGVVGEAQAPLITFDSVGVLTYNANTQAFAVHATPSPATPPQR